MKSLAPNEFLQTVYLGDRACKAVRIEGWRKEVVLVVDELSRIRSPSGEWQCYADEDIHDGMIVFTGVEAVAFSPSGPLPNDYINDISAQLAEDDPQRKRWRFEVSIGSVAADGSSTEIIMRLTGTGVHLEDPARPGVMISE